MSIRVYKCSNQELREEIRDLSSKALKFLLKKKKNVLNKVHISIKVDHDLAQKESAWGLCWWTDQINSPRRFTIVVSDKLSRKNFIKTLLHELVHVKQYLLGELKDNYNGNVKWKKKYYEDTATYYAYINMPWEKQAYQVSEILYKKYVNKYKFNIQ